MTENIFLEKDLIYFHKKDSFYFDNAIESDSYYNLDR